MKKQLLFLVLSFNLAHGMSDDLNYQKKFEQTSSDSQEEKKEPEIFCEGFDKEHLPHIKILQTMKTDGMLGQVQHPYVNHPLFPKLKELLQKYIENLDIGNSCKQNIDEAFAEYICEKGYLPEELFTLMEMINALDITCMRPGMLIALTHKIVFMYRRSKGRYINIPRWLDTEIKAKLLYYYPELVWPALAHELPDILIPWSYPTPNCIYFLHYNKQTKLLEVRNTSGTLLRATPTGDNFTLRAQTDKHLAFTTTMPKLSNSDTPEETIFSLWSITEPDSHVKSLRISELQKLVKDPSISEIRAVYLDETYCVISTNSKLIMLRLDSMALCTHGSQNARGSRHVPFAVTPDGEKLIVRTNRRITDIIDEMTIKIHNLKENSSNQVTFQCHDFRHTIDNKNLYLTVDTIDDLGKRKLAHYTIQLSDCMVTQYIVPLHELLVRRLLHSPRYDFAAKDAPPYTAYFDFSMNSSGYLYIHMNHLKRTLTASPNFIRFSGRIYVSEDRTVLVLEPYDHTNTTKILDIKPELEQHTLAELLALIYPQSDCTIL